MIHRAMRLVFALGAGLLLAFYAYQWTTDPELAAEQRQQEAAVLAARGILASYVEAGAGLEVVDPLAPRRAVGKVYIYPVEAGWDVSGYYRRNEADEWHPFLLRLDDRMALVRLSVRDSRLESKAAGDSRVIVAR